MKEIWKDIKGYESFYQVSNLGNVRSLDRYVKNGTSNRNIKRGRVLKPCINHKGYLQVHLVANGNSKLVVIHRLVAKAFIPNPQNKAQVNHIDGNKKNNNVRNLEWCTNQENVIHAINTGLIDLEKLKNRKHYTKAVNQYSINGEFIKRWDSIKDVQKEWNLKGTKISSCFRGKIKTSLGYKWKYAD